jgi:prepilin-type N-terminal cleavage/methylation domain-containing protein
MKNKRAAFTLVELLAVVVILGILMMIAVPNTIALIDKNKKTTYLENAKTFVSLVQNKVQVDKTLELPTRSTSALVVTLDYLNTNDIVKSPYGERYNKEASFVAITLEESRYVYYVHLVSCTTSTCDRTNLNHWRGIEFVNVERLNNDERFDLVKASGVNANLINNLNTNLYLEDKILYVNDKRI